MKRKIKKELDWMSDDLLYHHIACVYGLKDLVWEECTKEEYYAPYPRSWEFKDHGCVCQYGIWRYFRVVLGNFLHELPPDLMDYLEKRRPYWYEELKKKRTMPQDPILTRINLLRREINKHRYHYYILNKPLISDFEYDMLEKMLKDLEEQYPQFDTSDSPTHTVGSDIKQLLKNSNY